MTTILKFAASRPWLVLASLLLISLASTTQLSALRINISAESMLERDTPAWEFLLKTQETFGADDITVIYLSDLQLFTRENLLAIRSAVEQIGQLPFVERTTSLFSARNVKNENGYITTRAYFDRIPEAPLAIDGIRDQALANPLIRSNLLSPDGKAMAINVIYRDNDQDPELDQKATAALDRLLGPLQNKLDTVFHIGNPGIRDTLTGKIRHDQYLLLPLSLGVLLLTLTLSLRRLSGALIPLFTAGLSVIWTLGFMAALDIPVNIMTSIVPALIIVIGSTEDIHLLAEYLAGIRQGLSREKAIGFMARHMGLTILLTFITTYAGFLSITLNRIDLLFQFGLVASSGLLFNFIITITLVPVMLRAFGDRNIARKQDRLVPGMYARMAVGMLRLITRHRALTLYLTALICALSLVGASRLSINNNPMDYLEPESPLHTQADRVHRDLAGIHTFSIVLDSGIKDTFLQVKYLRELRKIQDRIGEMPMFDQSTSFADFIALVNRIMDDLAEEVDPLPEDDEIVREYMLFIQHHDVREYVSRNFGMAKILVRHNIGSSQALNQAVAQLHAYIATQVDPAFRVEITGQSVLSNQAVDSMAHSQFKSLLVLALVIMLVISILFLNLKAGFVALLPNLFPVIVLFGAMGFVGIPLNAGTSMVAAIALGVCVDDTMHLMSRYHQKIKLFKSVSQALRVTVEEEAVPIVTTSLALAAGFAVLTSSDFIPVAQFGLLSAMVILMALFSTFVISPLLLGNAELLTVWELLSLRVRKHSVCRSPLFLGMNTWQIKKVLLTGEIRDFASNEQVYHKEQSGTELYLVLNGRVEYRLLGDDGSVNSLGQRLPGQIFGVVAVLTSKRRSVDVVAMEPSQVLLLNWERISRISRTFPLIALKLYRNLSTILGDSLSESRRLNEHIHDDLTGIYCKTELVSRIQQEMQRALRYGSPLSLLSLAIRINDGDKDLLLHQADEDLQKLISDEVKQHIREVDILARWNNGNLAVLMPNTQVETACMAAERMKTKLLAMDTKHWGELGIQCRCTPLDETGLQHLSPADDGPGTHVT